VNKNTAKNNIDEPLTNLTAFSVKMRNCNEYNEHQPERGKERAGMIYNFELRFHIGLRHADGPEEGILIDIKRAHGVARRQREGRESRRRG
jgi:hypothetical protein